jgi:putative colanic acid biosysnthesis UDP-glucose lipid carrier transferase
MRELMITNQGHTYSLRGIRKKHLRTYIKNKTVFLFSKRVFDIIASFIVIVFVLSWLIPLLGMIIKLNSRGPIFFTQRRVGRGLKSFRCIKFRTMVVNCEANKCPTTETDRRVTSVGKFLRITSFDELPQFINVFMGDMSIVGPRPHMFYDCKRFSNYIQYYKFRSLVRPGITGLAQIKGFRGPAEDPYKIASRFSYDSMYIRQMNFGLDLNIILKTAAQTFNIIFFKRIAERKRLKRLRKEEAKKIAA